MGNGARECEWRHACAEDFGDLRKVKVEFLPRKKTIDFRSSPRPCGGCCTWWWADGKVVIERLCLSFPYVEKLFNSKVIKSFVPELRSRQVFFCVSGFLCYLYMSNEHSMYISHIYVWLCNTNSLHLDSHYLSYLWLYLYICRCEYFPLSGSWATHRADIKILPDYISRIP